MTRAGCRRWGDRGGVSGSEAHTCRPVAVCSGLSGSLSVKGKGSCLFHLDEVFAVWVKSRFFVLYSSHPNLALNRLYRAILTLVSLLRMRVHRLLCRIHPVPDMHLSVPSGFNALDPTLSPWDISSRLPTLCPSLKELLPQPQLHS